jgi:hypothetical protein
MRTGRLLAEEGALEACYHCVTRVVERRFAFGEREKEKFVEILRAYEEFCGVQARGAGDRRARANAVLKRVKVPFAELAVCGSDGSVTAPS